MYIATYLKYTVQISLFYNIDLSCRLEIYIDANFIGLWIKETLFDPNYVLSRSRFAIFLFRYLLFWYSKLQTKIALSTAEAKYIALSQILRNVILLINLVNELALHLKLNYIKSTLCCTVFKDNQSTIAISKAPSMLPNSKHISLKYYYFCQFIINGYIDIKYINTKE